MTFAEEIEKAAEGPIEAVVIGGFGWSSISEGLAYREEEITRKVEPKRGVKLSWEEARPMLDYEYDHGFGAPECDAVWAWSESRVVFVSEYDGSTGVVWVPRHPQDGEPQMSGGG